MTYPTDTAALRALLEKATKGPWHRTRIEADVGCPSIPNEGHVDIYIANPKTGDGECVACATFRDEDGALAVAAVNALPALLDAVDERDVLAVYGRTCEAIDAIVSCESGEGIIEQVQHVKAERDALLDEVEALRAENARLRVQRDVPVRFAFRDWQRGGESIYSTEEGFELSMGDFHSGTVFDGTIRVDEDDIGYLTHAFASKAFPVFTMFELPAVARVAELEKGA